MKHPEHPPPNDPSFGKTGKRSIESLIFDERSRVKRSMVFLLCSSFVVAAFGILLGFSWPAIAPHLALPECNRNSLMGGICNVLMFMEYDTLAVLLTKGGGEAMSLGFVFLLMHPFVRVLVWSVIAHLGLNLTRAGHGRFSDTFAVYGHTYGTASLLKLIPFWGAVAGLAVFPILTIIGLHRIHRVPVWKCLIAVSAQTAFQACIWMLFILLASVPIGWDPPSPQPWFQM